MCVQMPKCALKSYFCPQIGGSGEFQDLYYFFLEALISSGSFETRFLKFYDGSSDPFGVSRGNKWPRSQTCGADKTL